MLGCRRKDLITFFFYIHSSKNLKNILKKKKNACQVDVLIDLKISLSPKTCRSSHCDMTPILTHHYRTQSLYSQLNQMTLPSLPDPTVYNLKVPTFYSINLFRHQKSESGPGNWQQHSLFIMGKKWNEKGQWGKNLWKNDWNTGERARNIQQLMKNHEDFCVVRLKKTSGFFPIFWSKTWSSPDLPLFRWKT